MVVPAVGDPAARTPAEVPTTSPESQALSKALKRKGFVFVGPTTMYALMEAVGIVDTHLLGSHRRGPAGSGPSEPTNDEAHWHGFPRRLANAQTEPRPATSTGTTNGPDDFRTAPFFRCGARGFEPLTPSMPWRCATNCATAPSGCPRRVRR